jgi:predicted GNAT family N-acyltransferase
METIGYFRFNSMTDKKDKTGLPQVVLKQRLKKESAKVECLIKAIEKHKTATPDEVVRVSDQNLWSAGEMINYGN